MALEAFDEKFFLGLSGAGGYVLAFGLAFHRYWMSNRAKNANDAQHVDMLDRQERSLDRLEKENAHLRGLLDAKDQEVRQYFKELSLSNAKLQMIEQQLQLLKEQNEMLSNQVARLTETNKELASEVAHLRATMRT